ncbi:phosphatase PAP2 family protein [Candidatus Bathyarchaeota archaeon]|nr:phosphatase PAP2 family protein [Candidatus Bathyarchaeota archaeon]
MKKHPSFASLYVIIIPSIAIVLADLIIGDYELFKLINQGIINSILDVACIYASPVLFSIFYLLTLVRLYVSHRTTAISSGAISLITGPLCYLIGSAVKLLVKRPRPFIVLQGVRVIGPWETGSFSFPSTTTMLAFGLAIPILLVSKNRVDRIVLSVLSYFIGFSVIYAGFHFPADVVAGILISLAITLCTTRLQKPIVRFLETRRTDPASRL